MNIAILSRNKKLYSTQRLIEVGEERGHEITVLDVLKCDIDIASHRPTVWFKGEKVGPFDAVIPRIGASVTAYGCAVLRQFEMMGSYPANESVAVVRSRDKLRSLQILARAGIGLPLTAFTSSPDSTKNLINIVGGAPLVVKLIESTQGKGVILAETAKAAESLIDAFRELKANFLVQEFIKEASGADIRCLVVGDKVVGSMRRQAKDGEFRSNLHRGGVATLEKITPEERSTAVRAANKMGLNISGVDILRSNHGPVVLEVNSSPGLQGIETATGKDIAGIIYQFIEKKAKVNRTRTRGQG